MGADPVLIGLTTVRRGSGLRHFVNKTAALLLCLLGTVAAQDADARKAERIANQGHKLQDDTKAVWKKFVFEYRELAHDEL